MNNILMNVCGILIDIHEKELASEEKLVFYRGVQIFRVSMKSTIRYVFAASNGTWI